ncbi:ATP-binding protein [Nocardia vinacea]|uniref:AAA family ATPase n=1 Tax=Nocardia vinacea TaxID=96468 RepID=UPI002E10933C|nr:ATP-binding protein [Nocardia vinacea]
MPRLIHLNGMPAVGKSTLAALYTQRHPGVLNLDIDRLQELVGDWLNLNQPTHDILRPVALAMASAHLRGGRDVIVPYFLGHRHEILEFQSVAAQNEAEFCQIALLDSKDSSLDRFMRRQGADLWSQHVLRCVEQWGGTAYLEALHDQLLEYVETTQSVSVVASTEGDPEQTYSLVLAALTDHPAPESGRS